MIHHKMLVLKMETFFIDANPKSFEFGGFAMPEDCVVTFSDNGYFVEWERSDTWITVSVKSGSNVNNSPCTFVIGAQNLASGQRSGTVTFKLIEDGGSSSVSEVEVSVVQTVLS